MDWIESRSKTKLHTNKSRRGLSIQRKLSWPRPVESHDNTENDNYTKRNRYNVNLHTIAKRLCLIFASTVVATPAYAADVGGVSATANPIANSSGSVTNQAIQVLQGPYITNTYGGGVQCQGSTLNMTPYIQFADSRKDPWEDFYLEPQYNMNDFTGKITEVSTTVKNYPWYNGWKHDNAGNLVYDDDGNKIPTDTDWYNTSTYISDGTDGNEVGDVVRWFPDGSNIEIIQEVDGPDGIPDNPGKQIWQKPVRTDMKANQSLNLGLSATLSIPLNRKMVRQCHEAAQAQNDMATQLVANKRLDFEIARLKNCGELMQKGIIFHPRSPYASICADVVVTQAKPGSLPDHTHQLGNTTTSSSQSSSSSSDDPSQNSLEANPSSPDTDLSLSQKQLGGKGFFQGLSLPWQKPSSQEALSPSGADLLGVWQVGQMKSQPQQ